MKKDKSISWKEKATECERNLVMLLKNNCEIRRFTALAIITHLINAGEMSGTKRYVNFFWNKFRVTVDGIRKEYQYTETFFINSLVSSFESFRISAQKTIENYINEQISRDNIVTAESTDAITDIDD